MLKSVPKSAWESASERVRVVVCVGERLRMHVGARESAFPESAPESDWEFVCLRERVRVLCLRVLRERVLCESLLL